VAEGARQPPRGSSRRLLRRAAPFLRYARDMPRNDMIVVEEIAPRTARPEERRIFDGICDFVGKSTLPSLRSGHASQRREASVEEALHLQDDIIPNLRGGQSIWVLRRSQINPEEDQWKSRYLPRRAVCP